jgi:hypothetical protein
MSFASDLSKFAQKTGTRMDQVVRKVCIDLTRDLILATPVDTGLARSSYFFGTDRNASVGDTASKNGSPSLTRSAEFAQNLKAGGVFYITNNVVYIMPLEFGHSKQAPAGMARVTVDRWQARLDGIVRQVAQ